MFDRLGTLPDAISRHASFLYDERISEMAADARKHPEEYADYFETHHQLAKAAKAVEDALGEQAPLLETLIDMFNARNGVEYVYIYKLGFMDGGRVYHDFVAHKPPKQKKHRRRRRS